MSCQQVQTNLCLYLYGELDFAQEEAIERHLGGCALCQSALSRERAWHRSVTAEQQDVSFELLSDCRLDLRRALRGEWNTGSNPAWWKRLIPAPFGPTRWSAQVAAASFLAFVGFMAARLMDSRNFTALSSGDALRSMSLVDAPNVRIRDIQPNGQNGVRIVLDRVQQQQVTGNLGDDIVRQLLLNAMRDPSNPGIRVDSVELLRNQRGNEVRDALVDSVEHDTNAAVRMKALEGLRPFANDSKTREAIEAVLKHDENPDVRSEAIDILVPADQILGITPDVLTTLQDILSSERDNEYVRSRSLQVLRAVNAGTPVF